MSSNFKLGDDVEAYGLIGNVAAIDETNGSLRVNFLGAGCFDWFLPDGRAERWHMEPVLKLVERPKKKVKRKVYIAIRDSINQYSSRGGRDSSLAFEQREHAENQFSTPYQIIETEIEVDE